MNEPALLRAEMIQKLAVLDGRMASLKKDYPDEAAFWQAFADEADAVTAGAVAENYWWALEQIDVILIKHGRGGPSDDIGPSDGRQLD